ncbi:MAG: YdeI/OmpD-associated family protein [Bacteroidia bacterium]|nr:YdeI/OmpD-associated family protein [Bacteroidia bacterium]
MAEAICFGWIDSLRHGIDEISYKNKFTPRKPNSTWSAVNIKMVEDLTEAGLMEPAGLAAFARRKESKSRVYSFEQQVVEFEENFLEQFKKHEKAFEFFENLPKSVKKPSIWWVISAKREETKQSRLEKLIECSENGLKIPMLRRKGDPGT